VAFTGSPLLVFRSDGTFLTEAGRIGDGPGEFRSPSRLISVGDSVVLFTGDGTVLVFGPDFRHVRSVTGMNARTLTAVAASDWPKSVILSANLRQPATAGFPLHLADFSGASVVIRRSFGSDGVRMPDDPAILRQGGASQDMKMERGLAASGGTVFALTRYTEYTLTQWDTVGRLLWEMPRQAAFFPRDPIWTSGSTSRQPSPRMVATWFDDSRLLWTYGHVAKDNWQQIHREYQAANPPPPGGGRGATMGVPLGQAIRESAVFQTLVEVVDVQARSLLATRTVPAYIVAVLPDGRFVSYREAADGTPYVDVYALTLERGFQWLRDMLPRKPPIERREYAAQNPGS
jgi:hypothetical protein